MFCEIARRRAAASQPTVLFLAEQFVPGEPWSQMLNILGLHCDRDEFLGALDAIAEARGSRALVLIDALNEESGWEFWPKHLPGMLTEFRRHQMTALAVSVRSSYEELVISKATVTAGALVRFVHGGFQGREEESVDRYFAHYGIELPSFPILDPEFSNPLFLKVLCEGIQNKGLDQIPIGLRGFTDVFQFFMESVNQKLARPNYLDYDAQRGIVMSAVECLVRAMIAAGTDWLPRDAASQILEAVLPTTAGFNKSLFRQLLAEGVLIEEIVRVGQETLLGQSTPTRVPSVGFQYQRFADYLIVQYLLDPHLKAGQPEAAFAVGQPLGRIVSDPQLCRRYQGRIEALAVLIPESTGRELPAFVPESASSESFKNAVSASLIWRRATSISPATWIYIAEAVLPDTRARQSLLRTLVLVAPDPAHPYNARFLHDWLLPMRMVERDALWSTFLGYEYARGGVVARLLRWAESITHTLDRKHESSDLAILVLAWFHTSSSRVLRDRATKSLVAILSEGISKAQALLNALSAVNDDYVFERVAAAVYGAAMRCQDVDAVGRLAAACAEQFFERRQPPPNALTRDYLRGVVELSSMLSSGLSRKFRAPLRRKRGS
jgi:hypothetical protein